MNDLMKDTFGWIRDDWNSNKFRFVIELLAWSIIIGCSLTMEITLPNPTLVALYHVCITC